MKSPKFYFFDTGVLNAAAKELNSDLVSGSARFGRLFEQFIINEFYRMNDYYMTDYSLSYYSTGHSEVDLVLAKGRGSNPIGVEIKSFSKVFQEDLSGLQVFSSEYPSSKLFCVCTAPKSDTITLGNGNKVSVLPYEEAVRKILIES